MSKTGNILIFLLFSSLLFTITLGVPSVNSEENAMYFTLLVKWERTVKPSQPNLSYDIINYDNYAFKIMEVVISNITVWSGEFEVDANDKTSFVIDDISQVFELNISENNIEVYIDKSPNQPLILEPIHIFNNSLSEIGVNQFTLIYLEHSIPFLMPSWIDIGKNAFYKVSIWNSTNYNNYTTNYLVENVSLTENIVYTNWTQVNETEWRIFYPTLGPTYFFSSSHIDAIKEKPTRFVGLLHIYIENVEIDTPLGKFETIKIKREYPPETVGDVEDYVWVEVETGLRMKRYTRYPGSGLNLTSDYIINSHLLETNILESRAPARENMGIPGFPLESIIIGVILVSIILYSVRK
jgi:hypothetical protein